MRNDRKIVFINQASGYLTIDIVNAFAERFSETALISWDVREQDVPLNSRVQWSKINRYNRLNPRTKFVSWLRGTLSILYLLTTKYRKYEIFYITIPPMAYLLSLALPQRFSVLIFDLYPDVLKIYNISEKNIFYKLWVWSNKRLFKRAHRVYTLGEGMRQATSQYINTAKINVIPNWSGLTQIKEINKSDNIFIKEQDLEGRFIVQYSGNIGVTHNVEILVTVAERLKYNANIFFLIIGRGEKYEYINDLIKLKNLNNCRLLPYQPDHMLNYTLSAADLGVVVLDTKSANASVPSKIYNIQAVGVPILAIASSESELERHINYYQNGKRFAPDEIDDIVTYVVQLSQNDSLLRTFKNNSSKAAADFTSANARQYVEIYLNE